MQRFPPGRGHPWPMTTRKDISTCPTSSGSISIVLCYHLHSLDHFLTLPKGKNDNKLKKKINGVVLLYASEQEYWRKNQVWIKEKMFILDEKTFLTVVGVIAQWNSLPRGPRRTRLWQHSQKRLDNSSQESKWSSAESIYLMTCLFFLQLENVWSTKQWITGQHLHVIAFLFQ